MQRAKRLSAVLVLIAWTVMLGGCSSLVDQDQPTRSADLAARLEPGHNVGQSFVAQHAGLNGVDVWLSPEQSGSGMFRLHLYADPLAQMQLAQAALPIGAVVAPGFYHFGFPSLPTSHNRYLYALWDVKGAGTAVVGTGAGSAYINGSLYQDGKPLDGQMSFRLTYDRAPMLLDLGVAVGRGVGLVLLAGLIFLVPGWALLALSGLTRGRTGAVPTIAEQASLAVGLSLACYPLLLLWSSLVGLHLGAGYVWLPVVAGLVVLGWRMLRGRRITVDGPARSGQRGLAASLLPHIALLVVLAAALAVRLLSIRTLDAPMWGDSYQHTTMAQLIIDHGGLFNSWEPYAPYRTLSVQFGFSFFAALLSWATGMASPQATLIVGQIINALAAFTLYPLAIRIARGNRWAGVGAVLVASLLSPLPAGYVNWGRYAQLAGQAILPIAIWLTWESLERERVAWRVLGLAGMLVGGMALTYYRMPFYYATFILVWLLIRALPRWRKDPRKWLRGGIGLAVIALVALAAILPWVLHVKGSALSAAVESGVTVGSPWQSVVTDYLIWRQITDYVPLPLLVAALIALGWALLRRQWNAVLLGCWTLVLSSISAGRMIHLPGANMMQSFAVVIALYIPVALVLGWLTGQVAEARAGAGHRTAFSIVLALAITVGALLGAKNQIGIIDAGYELVTRPDTRAMAWIRDHTPQDAVFLAEGFRIYNGSSAVGADAGWWIPLLSGRRNSMPPQYALLNERPNDPTYSERVVGLVADLENTSPGSERGIAALCDWGITHVYIGQSQGLTGAGVVQLYTPANLLSSPSFKLIYHEDRVYIFALNPESCEGNRAT